MTRTKIRIRKATVDDAPELHDLIRQAMAVYAEQSGIETPLDAQMETREDLVRHLQEDQVLVAVLHDQLAGTVRLVRLDDQTAYFCRFAVLPGYQRSGVGQMLNQAAENWLADQGFTSVILHTALTNAPLVSFYRLRGFELVETHESRGYPRGTFAKKLLPHGNQPNGDQPSG